MEPAGEKAADLPGPSSNAFEDVIRQTTLRWLRNFTTLSLRVEDFCSFLSLYLSEEATCLAEIRAVTEAEVLRVSGPSVQKFTNRHGGPVLKLVDNKPGAADELDKDIGEAEIAHELALAGLRFLNLTDWSPIPNEYLRQLPIIQRRNKEHPFYRVAVRTWYDLLLRFPDRVPSRVTDEACRLFASGRHGNFMSWFIELMMMDFANGGEAERAAMYVHVCNVLAKSVSPLHVAAYLHLSCLCEALIQQGFGVNQTSRMGTPLYCAVVKPLAFVSPSLGSARVRRWKQIRRAGPISDVAEKSQKATIQVLRDAGAAIPNKTACMTSHAGRSYASAVLLLSAKNQDLDLFTSLTRPELYLNDEKFIGTLEDPEFPFPRFGARDPETMSYLDGLCGFLIDQSWQPAFRKMWRSVWRKAVMCGVRCRKASEKRPLMLSDDDVAAFRNVIVNDDSHSQLHFLRWIQDDRKEANFVTDDEDGETLLHHAVSHGKVKLVKLLVKEANADVSVRDKQGRTPLHLCERHCTTMLRVLISHGADLSSTDNDGRTIWHYAAANADLELLTALMDIDEDKDASLKRTTKIGRTPLAEAFAYVRELVGLPPGEENSTPPQSIRYLLEHCRHDPAYLCSDIPILCYVAEWGCMPSQRHTLLGPLLDAHCSFDLTAPDGSSPLHYLNLSASRELILRLKAIPGVSELPVLNKAGLSPAETIFLAFKPSTDVYDGDSAHPSWNQWMDEDAYMSLLSDEVIFSRDQLGRTLWPRFCVNVLAHYCHDERREFLGHVVPSLYIAITCFQKRGVYEAFENPRRVFRQVVGQRYALAWVSPILDRLPLDKDGTIPAVDDPGEKSGMEGLEGRAHGL